jgi:hypothetical protein
MIPGALARRIRALSRFARSDRIPAREREDALTVIEGEPKRSFEEPGSSSPLCMQRHAEMHERTDGPGQQSHRQREGVEGRHAALRSAQR